MSSSLNKDIIIIIIIIIITQLEQTLSCIFKFYQFSPYPEIFIVRSLFKTGVVDFMWHRLSAGLSFVSIHPELTKCISFKAKFYTLITEYLYQRLKLFFGSLQRPRTYSSHLFRLHW